MGLVVNGGVKGDHSHVVSIGLRRELEIRVDLEWLDGNIASNAGNDQRRGFRKLIFQGEGQSFVYRKGNRCVQRKIRILSM